MRNFSLLLVFFCFSSLVGAQKNNDKSLIINIGKPLVDDVSVPENNSLLEFGFRKILGKDFAYEVFANRSYSNSTKPFFNNNTELIDYLNTNNQSFFNWSKIETYALGVKGHFFFINRPKTEFSFFSGLGLYVSQSEVQSYRSFSFNTNTGELLSIETEFTKDSIAKPLIMPGLAFRYWIWKKTALGVNAMGFFGIGQKEENSVPVQANFYSLAFNISFKL